MRRLILWNAAVLVAAIFFTPDAALAQHSCDRAYRGSLHACERDHAERCNAARQDARNACERRHGRRCEEYRQISHQVCNAHSDCRRHAERTYRACRRDDRQFDR